MKNPTWFEDDELFVRELRRGQRSYDAPRIPGYEDLKELRRGGQGVVFLGKQVSTRRPVAIKLILEGTLASRESRQRFEREIELVVTLRHPNIVRVYDSGETQDGRLYYIMEYIEGAGLDELIGGISSEPHKGNGSSAAVGFPDQSHKQGARGTTSRTSLKELQSLLSSPRDILELFAKICDGVQHAHQQGVIHRDLKPSNIRIDFESEPHVLDFGLAKLAESMPDATQVSRAGGFMGSLAWASPEQAAGTNRQIDIRSDVYSLGVILFQLLTGEFPYRVDGALPDALRAIQNSPPKSPREIRRDISDEVSTIVLKCLSKEPERRYQSAGELARDIRRYLAGEPIEAKRDSAWYAVRKTLDRYKTAARAVSILLIASLIFSAAMFLLRERAIRAEQLAAHRLGELENAHRIEIEGRKALEVQSSKTQKVRNFLDQTLRAVDPWKHPGRDLGPLREMLDHAVARLQNSFPDQPEVEAAIAGTLGWDYRALGLNEPAEKLLRRSHELYRTTLGDSHLDTMNALNNVATLMTELAQYKEAADLFEQLRTVQERVLGKEHPATLITINNLALDIDWQGRSKEAEALYRQALEAQTRLLGPQNPDRLHTLNNLAACLPALGKVEEAKQLFEELVREQTAAHGANHPETLQARMNLANFLRDRGQLADAEKMFREIVHTLETELTPDHPMMSSALHNLAPTVSLQGRPEEGLAIMRRSYELQVAFEGPEHPTTLNRKNELANTLIQMKQWDEAIPLVTELREQSERLRGRSDWRTLIAANNLAFALNQTGKSGEAEKIWNEVISLADADSNQQASAPTVATARANLGALLADQSRWSEAEAQFRTAIKLKQELGDVEHWSTAFIRAGLGRVLVETDRLDEAEQELKPAYTRLHDTLGDDHEKTQRAIGYLVRLYDKKEDSASAHDFRSKLKTSSTVSKSSSNQNSARSTKE